MTVGLLYDNSAISVLRHHSVPVDADTAFAVHFQQLGLPLVSSSFIVKNDYQDATHDYPVSYVRVTLQLLFLALVARE